MSEHPPEYNRELDTVTVGQVREALNAGAELILSHEWFGTEYSATIRARSLVDLVVNVGLSVLDRPDLTLDEAVRLQYSEDPEIVLGWSLGG